MDDGKGIKGCSSHDSDVEYSKRVWYPHKLNTETLKIKFSLSVPEEPSKCSFQGNVREKQLGFIKTPCVKIVLNESPSTKIFSLNTKEV